MTLVRLRPTGVGAPLPLVGAPPPAPVRPKPSGSTASGSGCAANHASHEGTVLSYASVEVQPAGSTSALETDGATTPASDATASARAMRRNVIRRTSGSDRPR